MGSDHRKNKLGNEKQDRNRTEASKGDVIKQVATEGSWGMRELECSLGGRLPGGGGQWEEAWISWHYGPVLNMDRNAPCWQLHLRPICTKIVRPREYSWGARFICFALHGKGTHILLWLQVWTCNASSSLQEDYVALCHCHENLANEIWAEIMCSTL